GRQGRAEIAVGWALDGRGDRRDDRRHQPGDVLQRRQAHPRNARQQHDRRGREGPGAGHGRARRISRDRAEEAARPRRLLCLAARPDLKTMAGEVHLYGTRHHGPGSARRLVEALDALKPLAVLIEGPADASELLPMLAEPDMVTPVALLTYAEDNPANASF